MKCSERIYPEWFINELVNEEDKEKARKGLLISRSKVEFRCENGHIYEQSAFNHIELSTGERKRGCSICGKIKSKLNTLKTISSKRVYPDWFITEEPKYGCPVCTHSRSKQVLEIEDYVKSLGYNVEHKRFRDSKNRIFEVDIFMPEKNVGIEYNGSYYHSIENERIDKDYHYNKFNECRKNDILLITIFDTEWENKSEEIKQYIKDILDGKENKLSYNKEGYMNNNYPSWKYYKDNGEYINDHYAYNEKQTVYTCGYTKL